MAVKLTIDAFEFLGFEVPDSIGFGGAQSLSIHKLPGGSQVVDSMGRDDAPLEWSGIFTGASALSRARFLDGYRTGGTTRKLTWGAFSYNVVIREFTPRYERDNHIPYRIVCEVVEDLTTPITQVDRSDIDAEIDDDMTNAGNLSASLKPSLFGATQAAIAKLQGNIATVVSAYNAAKQGLVSVVNMEMSVISTIQTKIDGIQGEISGVRALVSNGIGALTNLFGSGAPVITGGNGSSVGAKGAALLQAGTIETANFATLGQITAALALVNRNLGYINGAPNAQQVTVMGGNLVDLALQYYGDAARWTVIAAANNLTDPAISGQITLFIPPAATTPANSGGGADVDHWMGGDVALSGSGDLNSVLGTTKSQQLILRRLLTNPQGYLWHPTYGAGVLARVGDTEGNLPYIEGLIISQMQLEQGVANPQVSFDVSGDDVTANIQYTDLQTNSRQFLSFTVAA